MTNSTAYNIKFPTDHDVEMARKELRMQLAEAAKYSNEECSDYNAFFEQLMRELHEKV